METRFTAQTGIVISANKVYSPTARRDVVRWGHFDTSDGRMVHVGPWYGSKAEALADHEDYLHRAGWMGHDPK